MPGCGRCQLSYSMVKPLGQCPLQGTTALRVSASLQTLPGDSYDTDCREA